MLNRAEKGLGREAPGLRAGRATVFGWWAVSQQHPVLTTQLLPRFLSPGQTPGWEHTMGTYLDGRGSLGKEKRERVQG